jgi:hypothetical protein
MESRDSAIKYRTAERGKSAMKLWFTVSPRLFGEPIKTVKVRVKALTA